MQRYFLSALCLVAAAAPLYAQTPRVTFKEVGDLPGGEYQSVVKGISGDGRVVVGYSYVGTAVADDGTEYAVTEAFRWTMGEGIQSLGNLQMGRSSRAHAASYDGSVIVGMAAERNLHPFRWEATTGMVALTKERARGYTAGSGLHVSANGDVVIGYAVERLDVRKARTVPFRWLQAEREVKPLAADLVRDQNPYSTSGCSADGSVVVGYVRSPQGFDGWMWSEAGGLETLGDLPGGTYSTHALGVSADGKTIVGQSASANGTEPVLWRKESGLVSLNAGRAGVPFGSGGSANDASADGSIIVGVSGGAMVWNANVGMQQLQEMLVRQFGVSLSGWTLEEAVAVSDDGLTIAGNGTHNGNKEGWVVRMEVPKPAAKKPFAK